MCQFANEIHISSASTSVINSSIFLRDSQRTRLSSSPSSWLWDEATCLSQETAAAAPSPGWPSPTNTDTTLFILPDKPQINEMLPFGRLTMWGFHFTPIHLENMLNFTSLTNWILTLGSSLITNTCLTLHFLERHNWNFAIFGFEMV